MMTSAEEQTVMNRISYWLILRLVFVMFSLYLMGDAFYRWDGFKYYASFSEFLPSVALASIFWSILSVIASLIAYIFIWAFERLCLVTGLRIRADHLIIFFGIFVIAGVTIWVVKRLNWPNEHVTLLLRQVVLLSVILVSVMAAWVLRNKSQRWIEILLERITPLVWLFGFWCMLSVPTVIYHVWIKPADHGISSEISRPPSSDTSRPNIILVTFDALTARDMSVYGYQRETTPFLTEWAKNVTLFTRANAAGNTTTPTVTSLMTGKRLWTHQTYHVEHGARPVKSSTENVPLLLKNNGYYNMAFIQNSLASVNVLNIHDSFDIHPLPTEFSAPVSLLGIMDKLLLRYFGFKIKLHDWIIKEDFILDRLMRGISGDITKTTVPPEKAFESFLRVLDNNPPEPYFAWIHLYPPHFPYLPYEPYIGEFDPSPELRTFKSQNRGWRSTFGYHVKHKQFPKEIQRTADILRSRYDEFIKFSDNQFEDFITEMDNRDRLKDTVIIVSSDHGESFEHAFMTHAGEYLFEQVTHIPLIMREPGQTEGRVIDDLVEQVDIPATILDLALIPIPSWMEGRSLVPLGSGLSLPPRAALSMALEGQATRGNKITKGTIAIWEDDYKLIHYLDKGQSLLFDLKQDPGELNNLFEKKPETGQRLLSLLKENLKKANEKILMGE
jgi:arylsulfatase A-like enzyme